MYLWKLSFDLPLELNTQDGPLLPVSILKVLDFCSWPLLVTKGKKMWNKTTCISSIRMVSNVQIFLYIRASSLYFANLVSVVRFQASVSHLLPLPASRGKKSPGVTYVLHQCVNLLTTYLAVKWIFSWKNRFFFTVRSQSFVDDVNNENRTCTCPPWAHWLGTSNTDGSAMPAVVSMYTMVISTASGNWSLIRWVFTRSQNRSCSFFLEQRRRQF